MQDYNKVLDATEVAENANGIAAEKMTVYNESLAAAQNRLTASIQQFAQDSNLDQILALAYDGLSKVVEILNILLNKIPILSPLIKALGVAIATAFAGSVISNMVSASKTLSAITSAAPGVVNAFKNMASGASGFSAVVSALGGPLTIILSVLGAIIAIAPAVASAFDNMANKEENAAKKASEEFAQAQSDLDDTNSKISDIDKKLNELNKKDKLTLSDQAEKDRLEEQLSLLEEIKKTQEDIVKEKKATSLKAEQKVAAKITGYDSEAVSKYRESMAGDYSTGVESSNVNVLIASYKGLNESIKELDQTDKSYSENLKYLNAEQNTAKTNLLAQKQAALEEMAALADLGDTSSEEYNRLKELVAQINATLDPSSYTKLSIDDMIDERGVRDSITKAIQDGTSKGRDVLNKQANLMAQEVMRNDSIKEAWADALNIPVDKLNFTTVRNEILRSFQEMAEEVEQATQAGFGSVSQVYADYFTRTEELSEAQTLLNKALGEMQYNGELTSDTVKDLIKEYPQLSDKIEVHNGKLVIEKQYLEDVWTTAVEASKAKQQAQIDDTKVAIENIKARIEAYKGEIEVLQAMAAAGDKSAGRVAELRTILDDPNIDKTSAKYVNAAREYGRYMTEQNQDLYKYTQALEKAEKIKNALGGDLTPTKPKGYTAPKKGTTKTDTVTKSDIVNQFKDIVSKYSADIYGAWNSQNALNTATTAYSDLLEKLTSSGKIKETAEALGISIADLTTDQAVDYVKKTIEEQAGTVSDAYQKLLKAELDAKEKELKARQEIEKQEKEQYDKALEYIEDLQDAMTDMIETGIDLLEKAGDIVFDLLGKISDRYDKQLDNIDKISDALDKQKDDFEDKIDAQKEMLKLQKEEMDNADELADKNKAIADIDAQLAELQYDNSAEAQAKRLKLLDERAEKEKDLADWQNEYDYNTKIDALDKEKSEYEKTIEAEKKALEAQKETIESAQSSFEKTLNNIQTGFNNFVKVLSNDVVKNLLAKALISYGGDTAKNILIGWNQIFGTGDSADITKLYDNLGKTGFQQGSWVGNFTNWLKSASNTKQSNLDIISNALSGLTVEKNQLEAGNIDLTKAFTSGIDVPSIVKQLGGVTNAFDNTQTSVSGILKIFKGNLTKFSNGIGTSLSPGIQSVSSLFGNLGNTMKNAFSFDWAGITGSMQSGLQVVSGTLGQLFGPIAKGAASIGDAIGAGITGFFPGIFSALGTLVTTVGTAMSGVLSAIATAMSSIPVAGWVIAAAAIAGAVALVGSIAAIVAKTKSAKVSQPTQSFTAKKHHSGADYVKKENPALDKMLGLNDDETVSILKVGEAVIPTWANNASSSSSGNRYTGSPFGSAVDSAVKSARANTQSTYRAGDSSVSISMPINIQGDADATTVKALKQEADNIVNKVLRTINNQTRIGGYRNVKAATV